MKNAYTLVELIFVIVIIGVLAGVASSSFKSDYLRTDMDYIVSKIKEAQYKGIGYEHREFGGGEDGGSIGCLTLTKSSLEGKATDGNVLYRLHVDLSGDLYNKTLCFDAKGQAHDDGSFSSAAITEQKLLELTYNGVTKKITILPVSGFAIIECN
jgi:prepilin-type N-terminal cleavage/methylation domain-containing protein